ncbi:MAG: MDR family MFS transporter [Thermoleophilia bacterium]|nr:MDR family MFS transporter [Thermoleophilia bacterium]
MAKPIDKKLIVTILGVICALLLAALDQTIVATAMPHIVQDFKALEHLSWVFTAYMLASTITIPIFGKLSDLYGRRPFYLLGIGIFLLGSILSGLAQSMLQLIIFRGIQGIGGGAIMMNSFVVISELFPPAERGKWQGVMGGIFGLSSILGPLLGGWLTDSVGWRWIFYINIPLGLLAFWILAAALPKTKMRHEAKIDLLGAFLLATGLITLLLGCLWGGTQYPWNSPQIIGLLGAAVVLLSTFLFVESKASEPILPLDLFANRTFLVSIIAIFLTAIGMFGTIVYIPFFAQTVIGISATNSGLILTPMMAGMVISSAIAGQIMSRTGKYKHLTVGGIVVMTFGLFLLSGMTLATTNTQLIMNMIIVGIGLGVTMPVFTLAVQSAFDTSKLGVVTASTQLFRTVGSTIGTAILGTIVNNVMTRGFSDLATQPSGLMLKKLLPQADSLNINAIQGFLASHKGSFEDILAKVPPQMQSDVATALANFALNAKNIITNGITTSFFIATLCTACAAVVTLFLPEIPLRKSNRLALEEAGVELETELGQTTPRSEPIVGRS